MSLMRGTENGAFVPGDQTPAPVKSAIRHGTSPVGVQKRGRASVAGCYNLPTTAIAPKFRAFVVISLPIPQGQICKYVKKTSS